MTRLKGGLAVLGLLGAIVGLVALTTSSVQAEAGASWNLVTAEGKLIPVTKELLPTVAMTEIQTKDMQLLFTTGGGTKVEFLCTSANFINARLETNGTIGGENITEFKNCVTYLNGILSKSCEPHTGSEKGVVRSKPLRGLLKLYELKSGEKDAIVLFEPVTGTTFLTIELGEECIIGESCAVTGKNSVKGASGKFSEETVAHSVEQGPLNELLAGGRSASVDGIGVLTLSGAHEGMKWAGLVP